MPTVCIVTPNYIAGTPRVVKEADALLEAGYHVRVVFSQGNLERVRKHDDVLLAGKTWQHTTFGWSPERTDERRLYWLSRLRHGLARKLPTMFHQFGTLAETALGRVYPELARLAAVEPADLFIGHYPDGLAAAAYAAKRWDALLAYDFEDFYVRQGVDTAVQKQVEIVEKRYLSRSSYTSAASPLMADTVAEFYQIERPVTIYNVFPWADRNTLDSKVEDRRGDALSIYWYSQTVGLDRGIQDAIRAMALVDTPIQLHVRGALSDSTRDALLALATACGVAEMLYFHAPVAPDELLSRAVEHDIGLAAEQPVDSSRQISVTNKLFVYLLAGLCIVASDMQGQRQVLNAIPNAGYLYPVGDYASLAVILRMLVDHPEVLRRNKEASLAAARNQWNWENESGKLVRVINGLLSQGAHNRAAN